MPQYILLLHCIVGRFGNLTRLAFEYMPWKEMGKYEYFNLDIYHLNLSLKYLIMCFLTVRFMINQNVSTNMSLYFCTLHIYLSIYLVIYLAFLCPNVDSLLFLFLLHFNVYLSLYLCLSIYLSIYPVYC